MLLTKSLLRSRVRLCKATLKLLTMRCVYYRPKGEHVALQSRGVDELGETADLAATKWLESRGRFHTSLLAGSLLIRCNVAPLGALFLAAHDRNGTLAVRDVAWPGTRIHVWSTLRRYFSLYELRMIEDVAMGLSCLPKTVEPRNSADVSTCPCFHAVLGHIVQFEGHVPGTGE